MANGRERTLNEFSWNSSQTPSVQLANLQSALNSGEPIRMPVMEDVTTDGTAVIDYSTTVTGTGASRIVGTDVDSPILQVRTNHVKLSGFKLGGQASAGILLYKENEHVIYTTIENMFTDWSLTHGIESKGAGGCRIVGGMIAGDQAAIYWRNLITADAGDNKIIGTDVNANANYGIGLDWESGGGMYVGQAKFNIGYNHIKQVWNAGGSGNFTLTGSSLETCTHISVDIHGPSPFVRTAITGNSFGVNSVAIAVRNFWSTPFLDMLAITGNVISVGGATPGIDLGSVENAIVMGNVLKGWGIGTVGVIARAQCQNSLIGNNVIRGFGAQTQVPASPPGSVTALAQY